MAGKEDCFVAKKAVFMLFRSVWNVLQWRKELLMKGAVLMSRYENMFARIGKTKEETMARLNDLFQTIFFDEEERFYFETPDGRMGYMLDTGNIVLGCRDFTLDHVPARSRFGNQTTSAIFKIFVGMTLSDTQTGLRAIPKKQLKTLVEVFGDRFEYETNMLLAMKTNGLAFDEVKIRTVYIEENKSSHFRVIHDSWRIYKLILAHFFRYTISSLVAAVVDTAGYSLLSALLSGVLSGFSLTAAAGVGARVVSSLINFFMNKKLVFQTNVSTGKAMAKYYALALPQMAAQVMLTQGAYALLQIPDTATGIRTLIYAVVMTVLFILSYMIQQRWVFAPQKQKEV
jgi:putative flippase GtrA